LLHKQILMSVQNNIYSVFIAITNYLSNSLYVRIVVDSFLGLDTFPCAVQSNYIHSPSLKILQVFFCEAVIRVEIVEIRMKGIDFVDNIYAMIDSIATVLVHKHRVIRIDFD
jgi:hypothetical protein